MNDIIRQFRRQDADALAQLMHAAIQEGAAGAYAPDQLAAWSPEPLAAPAFAERIAGRSVLVAEDASGVAGFFALTSDGLLDLAFVRPDRKGDGLAARLHGALLERARRQGLTRLTVEASHLARRFLAKQGWALIGTKTVTLRGATLVNHSMCRDL